MGRVLFIAAIMAACAACGPIHSMSNISAADVELKAARTADAEKRAPYEYTLATLYLHQAKVQQGHAEFKAAIRFAEHALEFAKQAKNYALNGRPQVVPESTSARDKALAPVDAPPPSREVPAPVPEDDAAPALEPIDPDGEP